MTCHVGNHRNPVTMSTMESSSKTGGTPIVFENVSYTVPLPQQPRRKQREGSHASSLTILHNLSGVFHAGRLTTLMGPSGAGKSTLLDVLAGRKNSGTVLGKVWFGGVARSTAITRSTVGYVEQFDTLVGDLTVEQMLQYTAALKLPRHATVHQRAERVKEVLRTLDLEACRHTTIGNALRRGISGGQAKRVNIGLALIPRPPILLLDEPTSGLDSRAAVQVVQLLQTLARQGHRTVVATIHAPSGHAFNLFDDLYMLSGPPNAGQVIFHGPLAQVQEHFEHIVGHTRDPVASLPEWLVDLTTTHMERIFSGPADDETQENAPDTNPNEESTLDFVTAYQTATLKTQMDQGRRELLQTAQQQLQSANQQRPSTATSSSVNDRGGNSLDMATSQSAPPTELSRLWTLLKYRTLAHYTDLEFVGPRFGDKVLFSLLFMSLYWRLGQQTDPRSVASIASLFFFIAAKCGFGAASFVPALTLERQLYYRELHDGMYSPLTYFTAKFLEEAFIALFTSLVFCVTVFYGCDLAGNFGIFFLAYYLTTLVGVILAYAFSAFFSSLSAANSWLPTYVTVNLYFSGFVILTEKIPPGWQWFSWTSFMRYSWGAMMVNNFRDSAPGRAAVFFDEAGNSQTVLEFYGMVDGPIMNNAGACLGMLTTILSVFTVIGVLCLVYIRHEKR